MQVHYNNSGQQYRPPRLINLSLLNIKSKKSDTHVQAETQAEGKAETQAEGKAEASASQMSML